MRLRFCHRELPERAFDAYLHNGSNAQNTVILGVRKYRLHLFRKSCKTTRPKRLDQNLRVEQNSHLSIVPVSSHCLSSF